jgi:hypothetical protein
MHDKPKTTLEPEIYVNSAPPAPEIKTVVVRPVFTFVTLPQGSSPKPKKKPETPDSPFSSPDRSDSPA